MTQGDCRDKAGGYGAGLRPGRPGVAPSSAARFGVMLGTPLHFFFSVPFPPPPPKAENRADLLCEALGDPWLFGAVSELGVFVL